MSTIERSARAGAYAGACATTASPRRGGGRGRVFATILRAAGVVASVALPGAGSVAGAVADAIGRRGRARVPGLDGTSETLEFLELQRAIAEETRAYEAVSNVMKARHDAAMNSIRNLRS